MLNNKSGCLMWGVLLVFVVLWGFKLLDFFILRPAGVRNDLSEVAEQVNRIQNTQAKQVEFLSYWADYERSCDRVFTTTAFSGDSFIVEWEDTLHVPVFPSIPHSFRQTRLIR